MACSTLSATAEKNWSLLRPVSSEAEGLRPHPEGAGVADATRKAILPGAEFAVFGAPVAWTDSSRLD